MVSSARYITNFSLRTFWNEKLRTFWNRKNFSRIKQCHSEAEKSVKRISFLENDGTTKDSYAKILANQNYSLNLQRMTKSYYYPYGGLMGESTGSDAQPYKYNGKELDRHSGLDWYDYGARWYNGISWMTPDLPKDKRDPNNIDDMMKMY